MVLRDSICCPFGSRLESIPLLLRNYSKRDQLDSIDRHSSAFYCAFANAICFGVASKLLGEE